jgi:hypothetical protein
VSDEYLPQAIHRFSDGKEAAKWATCAMCCLDCGKSDFYDYVILGTLINDIEIEPEA